MMDGTFLDTLEDLLRAHTYDVGGRFFTDKNIIPVVDPECVSLSCHTISGLRSFYDASIANGSIDKDMRVIATVDDHETVKLVSPLFGKNKQREEFIVAESFKIRHRFGKYMHLDDFNIYLQSCFVRDETIENILKITGNVVVGAEAEFLDDGMTQRVTAKAGVARVEKVHVPNPVTIMPYRTFPEVQQPKEKFVLRIKASREVEQPKVALFEADGGAWMNEAIVNVGSYVQDVFSGTPVDVVF